MNRRSQFRAGSLAFLALVAIPVVALVVWWSGDSAEPDAARPAGSSRAVPDDPRATAEAAPSSAGTARRPSTASRASGRVLTSDGEPAVNATVRCVGDGAPTTSDGKGRFSVAMPSEGCELVASRSDASPSAATAVRAGAADVTLRLRALGRIEGRVVDEEGEGVPGVAVGVELYLPPAEAPGAAAAKSTRTDSEGRFVLASLPPGRFVLSAMTRSTAPAKSGAVELSAGEARRDIRLTLDDGAVVEGRVTDARTGQPIAGAKVRLQAVTLARMWAPLTLETDDDGQFSLDGAPTDMPFTVRAQAEGYNTRLVGGLTADDRAVAIQLNPAEGEARKEVPTTGIIMRKAREGLQVVRVDENSPGRDAGLMAGDVIVAIDGRPTREMTHVEGVQRLRGEPGTSVTLAYERNGTREKATVLRALRIE